MQLFLLRWIAAKLAVPATIHWTIHKKSIADYPLK
jgi:hypothetical protein